jgi:uncharacterized protein (TIGR03067 family)
MVHLSLGGLAVAVRFLLFLAATTPLAADRPTRAAAKADRQALQGRWAVVAIEANGKQAPPQGIRGFTVTFRGDEVVMAFPGATADGKDNPEVRGSYRLHPGKQPRAIDFVPAVGPDKGKVVRGIYQLRGDTLKLCLNESAAAARPEAFAAAAGSKRTVLTCRRGKP